MAWSSDMALLQADPGLVARFEAGEFDEDAEAASLVTSYEAPIAEAPIAALERLVDRQALELEFLKGALKSAWSSRSVTPAALSVAQGRMV